MITISVLTLFPQVLEPFLAHSIIKRAQEKKLVKFNLVNWRDFTSDRHHSVDEHPYGGGAGMLLMIEPIVKAIEETEKKYGQALKILLSPQGKLWSQSSARRMVSKITDKHILLICGHYEGFDERLLDYIDIEVSIGNYVLSGGESAAIVVIDSLVRQIPGVLKKTDAIESESFMTVNKQKLFEVTKDQAVLKQKSDKITLLEYPQYTKPESFQYKKVPLVLLSGNHKQIDEWRLKEAWRKTKKRSG